MRRRKSRDRYPDRSMDDLVAVVVLDVVSVFVLLAPLISDTPLRYVFGLPFLLVLPGYAFVSALFPATEIEPVADPPTHDSTDTDLFLPHDLDGFERLALSVATSIVIVSTVVFVLDRSFVGVETFQTVVSIGIVTIVLAVAGIVRKRQLPESERFSVPVRRYLAGARTELVDPDTHVDVALNAILVACLVLAAIGVVYGATAPSQTSEDTEFHLLAENETGELLAEGYPSSAAEFDDTPVVVGIDNREGRTINYSLVVLRQRVEVEGNSSTVVDERELTRYSQPVQSGAELTFRHEPEPDQVEGASRIAYLLYRGSPPENPNATSAYRDLYLWLGDDETGATPDSESNVREPVNRAAIGPGSWSHGVDTDGPRENVDGQFT